MYPGHVVLQIFNAQRFSMDFFGGQFLAQGCFLGDLIFTSIQSSLSVVIKIIGPGVSANHASSNLTLTGW